jgi:hypothetical protein
LQDFFGAKGSIYGGKGCVMVLLWFEDIFVNEIILTLISFFENSLGFEHHQLFCYFHDNCFN